MPEPNPSGAHPVVWITKNEPLPETCVDCGMFTDYKSTAKLVQSRQRTVSAGETNAQLALGCLLHLLGPIGWLVAAILSGGEGERTTEKTVKTKAKIKVPQCRLCAGTKKPVPVDGNTETGRFAFQVHPRFEERLTALRQESQSDI